MKDDQPPSQTLLETKARYARENRLTTRWGYERHYLSTPEGHKVAQLLITPFAGYLRGDYEPPPKLSKRLRFLQDIDPDMLALMALAPLLNRQAHDAREGGYDPSRPMLFRVAIADHLRRYLEELEEPLASIRDRAHAGHWLMRCMVRAGILTSLLGYPKFTPTWKHFVDLYLEGLQRAHPAFQPHLKEPPPWTGWRAYYEDRLSATFVNDWSTDTRARIEAAFRDKQGPFRLQHVAGVDALSGVRLTLDPVMVDLAEKFAVRLMGHGGNKRHNDRTAVKYDIAAARFCLKPSLDPHSPFADLAPLRAEPLTWLSYSCDFRGRLNPHQHLNFAREDHVRAMFRFCNGLPLGEDGLYWLMVHCANSEGSTDKKTWAERVAWVKRNRQIIEKIAANPFDTFDLWKGADKPFQYVAACRELIKAWANPNFFTHLPVGFDCTCSGIQHWAMVCRDQKAGRLVNLTDARTPQDVYAKVGKLVAKKLGPDKLGKWWRARFEKLTPRQIRQLVKRPVMTLPYNAGINPRRQQITEEYYKLRRKGCFPNRPYPKGAMTYLAEIVEEAVKELLPGVIRGMIYISKVAKVCASEGRFVNWVSPTGFPVSNRYQVPNTLTLKLPDDGPGIRYRIADGVVPGSIVEEECIRSCAPNFIHSLDASHLISDCECLCGRQHQRSSLCSRLL